MKQIIHDFIKENKFQMDSSGLYLIGKGDLNRLLEKHEKQLSIYGVSQQRELLIDFTRWIMPEEDVTDEMIEKDVNTYLDN